MKAIEAKLKGINAIPVTAFDEQGRVDFAAMSGDLDFLISHGIEAIYPCGNTGEFYSLTLQETKEIVQFAVKQTQGRAAVIAGIGHDAATAADAARHAESVGADGLMIHQPVNPFMLRNGLIDYYRGIARSTTLPIVLYVRHEAVSADVLKEVAEEPNIVGVKYAINNLPSFSRAVQSIGERLIWICGTAEMWAPFFFAAGAVGFTSGLVNVYPERSQAYLELLRSGRFGDAMRLWNELRPFEELREMNANGNNVSVVKEAMRQLGRSNGIVRPPIGPLQPEEQAKVRDVLVRWGLLEHKGGGSQ